MASSTPDISTESSTQDSKNDFLYNIIKQFHNIPEILEGFIQLKTKDHVKSSKMKDIRRFECIVCDFKTYSVKKWKEHIMSIPHLSICQYLKNLYSLPCGDCKVMFYGSKEDINQHRYDTHLKTGNLPRVSLLMSDALKSFGTNSKPFYFFAHSETHSEEPLHQYEACFKDKTYKYCEFCNIKFICNFKKWDSHTLSVEHVTMKSIHIIMKAIKANNLCIEPEQLLPFHILKIFKEGSEYLKKCTCDNFIYWNIKDIVDHLFICPSKPNKQFFHIDSVESYECKICDFKTKYFNAYKMHVISSYHKKHCGPPNGLLSYYCNLCRCYTYSSKYQIEVHLKEKHSIKQIPAPMYMLLANKYVRHTNGVPNTFTDCNGEYKFYNPHGIDIYCNVCKINFKSYINEYFYHKISCEHIIMENSTTMHKQLAPNIKTKENI